MNPRFNTDLSKAKVRTLFFTSRTYAEIAAEVGFTRSKVCGMVARMQLRKKGTTVTGRILLPPTNWRVP